MIPKEVFTVYKIGITSYAFEHTDARFRKLRESGLSAVELSLTSGFKVGFKEFHRMAKNNDVLIWSCHLPYRPDISTPDISVRKEALEIMGENIRQLSDLGVDKFVVHPSLPLPEGADRNERKLCSMDTLSKLADIATECGAVIAVEDMVKVCLANSVEELSEIISANDKLRVCFDVNHLLNNTHEEFFEALGDKIATVHISDYDFVQERHAFPGYGKIDWPKLHSLFVKYGYTGVWMHELGLSETVEEDGGPGPTFKNLYDADMQIFKGQHPTVEVKK